MAMLSEQYVLNQIEVCRLCQGSLVVDPETEETVCSSCGIVYEGAAQFLPSIEGEISCSRMKYDLDLQTFIGSEYTDVNQKPIERSYDLSRLRKLDSIALPKGSERKSLSRAIDTIRRISERLHLGSTVAERAYMIYRKSSADRTVRRKAIASSAMASVCLACKELGIARSTREIEHTIRELNLVGVHHYSKSIKEQLKISDSSPDASFFVSKIASLSGLGGKTERRAIEIILQVKDAIILLGKKPVPIAAATLYLASRDTGERVTISKVACVAEVTPITVRKRIVEISQLLNANEKNKWVIYAHV